MVMSAGDIHYRESADITSGRAQDGLPLRVVILYEVFAPSMGYAPTCIAKELARRGIDVHYVTAELPPNHYIPGFDATYGAFLKSDPSAPRVRQVGGITVHRMDYGRTYGGVFMKGVAEKLAQLKPDVVQTFAHVSWAALQAARLRRKLGFALFTANHTTASVFPLANRNAPWWDGERIKEYLQRSIPGRFVSSRMAVCFGATTDCSSVARRFLGVPPAKLITLPLGVDTEIFHRSRDANEVEAAQQLRARLDVRPDEIMCVYTGRFSSDKNPLLLARAVARLRAGGAPFTAVFFGDGVQKNAITSLDGAIVRPFVPYTELGDLFRAADIGVWPTQESTSMLDAAACGTPIVVNDTLAATERVEGNGYKYRLNDGDDLVRVLLELASPDTRMRLGDAGARKISERFSWRALVEQRLAVYRCSLSSRLSAPRTH